MVIQIHLALHWTWLMRLRSPGPLGCRDADPGTNMRLGRDRERIPLLRGRFTTPGMFVACGPESTDAGVVGLLINTGATIHVAGGCWDSRLNLLPGVGMSARTVGGSCRQVSGAVCSSWI